MRAYVERTGTVSIPLPAERAFPLFTPEGERRWVEGWDPVYPAGRTRPAGAGQVFVVDKEEGASTWMVTRFDPEARGASYAYVLPAHRAVLVEVDVESAGEGRSRARVTYRMTSLSPTGDDFVGMFADGYDVFLSEWEEAIRRYVDTT